jgi:3-isopropylmalate dehydrogenase
VKATIVLLPGDGIGPEVVAAARRVLVAVATEQGHELTFVERDVGGAAIDRHRTPLPEETFAACAAADAVLLGAVGGPRWGPEGGGPRPEQGLLELRHRLELFANLRPIPVFEALVDRAPIKPALLAGTDLLFVRELTGGIYFGPRREAGDGNEAFDTMLYTRAEIERVARVAFRAARGRRGRVTSIDKANVLAAMRLWRKVVTEVAAEFPDVELEHQLVDSAAMRLLTAPAAFDVVLAPNLFGDVLSDEASVLAGSLGVLPSASLGASGPGLYEPVHGSAPDIAGQGVANPLGAILSAALLLRHSLGLDEEAERIESAVAAALDDGLRTADLGDPGEPTASTAQMTSAVVDRLWEARRSDATPTTGTLRCRRTGMT